MILSRKPRFFAFSPLALALLAACATEVPMPSNVRTQTISGGAKMMESVDFSYASTSANFSKLKLCVAENVARPDVQLSDSVGSFVGPATGIYYQANNRQTVAGGSIFKYVDDSTANLIATGSARAAPAMGGMVNDIVQFDLRAGTTRSGVTLTFVNITRALQHSGSVSNAGFNPVFTHSGARAEGVYSALEATAMRLKGCMG